MKIYLYTFPANYEDQISLGKDPMLKIGQTSQDCAETRVLQQMGTSTAQHHDLKGEFEVEFTDKQFHHFLDQQGFERPDGAGTEWFYITVEEATELLHEFAALSGGIAMPIRKSLQPRQYQQDFVDQYTSTEGDFLLFAKCRSGKSVMGMLAAQASDYKSVLVVSLRKSAANSWMSDPGEYTRFHEWDVVDLHDTNATQQIKKSRDAGRRVLMVGTVQGMDERFKLGSKVKRQFPNGIDALYLDECHIGGEAAMYDKLRKSLGAKRELKISGTAFKASHNYTRSNVFVWDYVSEQKANLGMPKMNLVLVNTDTADLKNVYGGDPDRLSNIWSVENGKWVDEASARSFFSKYFTFGTTHKKRQLFRKSNHIVMSLPSVDACNLAVELVKKMNLPWVPMSIVGDSGNDQAKILEHVENNDRTICFTKWANVVGVTVPKWDTVVHGAKTDSAEFWVQFSFRGGSTREDSWTVIDFNPEQTLSSVLDMVQASNEAQENSEPSNLLKTFLEFADVHEFENGFRSVDYSRLLQLSCSDAADAITLLTRKAAKLATYGEYSTEIASFFSESDPVKSSKIVDLALNSNNTANTGNTRLSRNNAGVNTNVQKALLAKIKGALKTIPNVVAVHAIENPINSFSQLLASPYLATVTGVSREGFEVAESSGWISKREVSALVSQTTLYVQTIQHS